MATFPRDSGETRRAELAALLAQPIADDGLPMRAALVVWSVARRSLSSHLAVSVELVTLGFATFWGLCFLFNSHLSELPGLAPHRAIPQVIWGVWALSGAALDVTGLVARDVFRWDHHRALRIPAIVLQGTWFATMAGMFYSAGGLSVPAPWCWGLLASVCLLVYLRLTVLKPSANGTNRS